MVARTLTATQIAALRIPTAEEVRNVADTIPQLELGTWREWDARPGSFLEVGPGILRFFRTASHLPDAARDRLLKARVRDSRFQLAHEQMLYRSPMALLTDGDVEHVARDGGKRGTVKVRHGKITAWSRRSRNRMQMQLNRLDYTPLFEAGLEPAMVTLTLPGEWEQLAPTPEAFKKIVDRFTTAYRNSWNAPIRGVWKMEFQRRGAPHLHILMTPPAGTAHGAYPYEFRQWLSRAWARAVGATGEERLRHEKAGTGVDYVGDGYRDPRRIAQYFGKHGFFEAKEYQNEIPELWRAAIAEGERGARYWGVWGLKKASAVLQLDDAGSASVATVLDPLGAVDVVKRIISVTEAEERRPSATDASVARVYQRAVDDLGSQSSDDVRVQRYMRKLSKSMAYRGVELVRNAHGQLVLPPEKIRRIKYEAAHPDTGEIRTLRRYRVGYYHGGGGFLLVNDGVQSARNVQRLLDHRSRWTAAA